MDSVVEVVFVAAFVLACVVGGNYIYDEITPKTYSLCVGSGQLLVCQEGVIKTEVEEVLSNGS